MPGLFGYWTRGHAVTEGLMASVADAMSHQPRLRREFTISGEFGAGRVHLGRFQPARQPAVDAGGRYRLWIEGEIVNRAALASRYGLDPRQPASDPELILELFRLMRWRFLPEVDGLFSLALYDRSAHELTLVSDRYGLQPLFWVPTRSGFAYAAELKALLSFPEVSPQIDPDAPSEFFAFGHMLGNRTWIKGIEVLPPATTLIISSRGVESRRYWDWNRIEPIDHPIDERDIVDELGRLWVQAVERRVDDKRLAVSLSGGFDSRSVVAAIPQRATSLHAITFGERHCDDVTIAKRVSRVRGLSHHVVEITPTNWIEPRLEAVWRTDGLFSILDLHGVEALPAYVAHAEVEIQSFAGDLILGGSYLRQEFLESWPQSFEALLGFMYTPTPLVSREVAKDALAREFVSYTQMRQSDFFFLDTRVRRFTNFGGVSTLSFIDRRYPTYDKELIEFVYSLDPAWRVGGRIYHQMLLRRFPEYYRDIPWQHTGLALTAPPWRHSLMKLADFAHDLMRRGGRWLGFPLPYNRRGFVNYASLLRHDTGRALISNLLLDKNAVYSAYISADKVRRVVEDFQRGMHGYARLIGLLLTFEVYFRRLLESGPKVSVAESRSMAARNAVS